MKSPKVERTILDTARPLAEPERRALQEKHQKEWVERVYPKMTRAQQVQMEQLLKPRKGRRLAWTPEEGAVLLEKWRQMRRAGLTKHAAYAQLAEDYRCDIRTIQNRLSKLRNRAG